MPWAPAAPLVPGMPRPSKAALVSTVHPRPITDGKKLVLDGIATFLYERLGDDFLYLRIGGDRVQPLAETPYRVEVLPVPPLPEIAWRIVVDTGLRRRRALQESLLFGSRTRQALHDRIASLGIELVVADTMRTGQYFATVQRPDARYVCYLDDLFSRRYERMLVTMHRFPDVELDALGNFKSFVPFVARGLVHRKAVQRSLLGIERQLVEQSEDRATLWFDSSLLINRDEAQVLKNRTGASNVRSIKPVVPDPGPTSRTPSSPPTFVFVGALNVPHNHVAVHHLATRIVPETLRALPGARFRVLGRGADRELVHLVERTPGIELAGFVDDLSTEFSAATAMVVPLIFGTGVKIKTLEALARGLPVVATSYGTEGIPIQCDRDALVRDDPESFVDALVETTDSRRNAELSAAARAFFVEEYGRDSVVRSYEELFLAQA